MLNKFYNFQKYREYRIQLSHMAWGENSDHTQDLEEKKYNRGNTITTCYHQI